MQRKPLLRTAGGAISVLCLVVLGSSLTGCPPTNSSSPPKYSVIRIGDVYGEAMAVNNNGEVAGHSAGQPFFWRSNNPSGELQVLTGAGRARGLNNAAEVVGDMNGKAFIWWPDTGDQTLIYPDDTQVSVAYAINSSGQVVGSHHTKNTLWLQTFSWTQASGLDPAFTYSNLNVSEALSVNLAGTMVGYAETLDTGLTNPQAYMWDSAGNGSFIQNTDGAKAYAISDAGEIVGQTVPGVTGDVTVTKAFSKASDGTDTLLPSLVDTTNNFAAARSANFWGNIAGYAMAADGNSHAVLWQNGQIYDLNGLIPAGTEWTALSKAYGINDNGVIVGSGMIQGDTFYSYPFILVPVQLSAFNVTPSSILVGGTTTATVDITDNAPFELNVAISQTGFNEAIRFPRTVTIPSGQKSVSFTVSTNQINASAQGYLVASFGGITLNAPLDVIVPVTPGA